jgi:hypothetical protein
MTLVAGDNFIDVKLSPNTNNFFTSMFEYSATISDINGNNAKTITLSNISTTAQQTITFSELENGDPLVNLEMYKIVAFYKMLNTDNQQYYSSNTTTNTIEPYDALLAPVLYSVSHDKMISISLDIAVFNGYDDITGYQISFDNVSWAPIIMSSTVDLNVFIADITVDQNGDPLVNGSEYHLYARIAFNINGESKVSAASNMVTNIPYTTASAPTNLTSEPGNQQVTLSWSAPSNSGGLGLDHYEVKMDNNAWVSAGISTSYIVTELTNGQSYTFYVRAVTIDVLEDNALVNGASASSVNIPYAAASAPIFANCVESDSLLFLTWLEPSSLGGLIRHHYEVSIDNGLNWASVGLATGCAFNNLVNGQEYILRVKLFTTHPYLSALVEGATLVTEPFYPYKVASAPIFEDCVEGDTQLVLTWSEPSDLGGLALVRYEVSSDDAWNFVSVGLVTSYTFTGLVNGQEYILKVRAVTEHMNLGSIIGATLVTESFYPYKASAPPQNLTSEPEDGKVVFNWTAADATINGLPFVTYQVSVDNSAWTDISTNTHSLTGANGVALILYVRFVTEHPNKGLILGENASDTNIPYSVPSQVDPASYTTDRYDADEQLVFSLTGNGINDE